MQKELNIDVISQLNHLMIKKWNQYRQTSCSTYFSNIISIYDVFTMYFSLNLSLYFHVLD